MNKKFDKIAKKLIKSTGKRRRFLVMLATKFLGFFFNRYKKFKGIRVEVCSNYLNFIRSDQVVRISKNHLVYIMDIIDSFDYYFGAVQPVKSNGFSVVDYSFPQYHKVIGYDRHPIFFSSFSEPLATTKQYLKFANLKRDMIVIDLGAYSGLTSIMYKDAVGSGGTVIAVDADDENIEAINKNFENYTKATGNEIKILRGAVWNNCDGIEFSTEGNMGSSAVSIVGSGRGSVKKVPSFTLSSIVEMFNLPRVDFIKCDIEGAESVIFEDEIFFKKFKPKIIVEAHVVSGVETSNKVMDDLKKYGYSFKLIRQNGVALPLIECVNKLANSV